MEARRRRVVGGTTVDGNQKSGVHQLSLVVYPIIYRVSYIPGGCLGFQPSTVGCPVGSHSSGSFNIEKWWERKTILSYWESVTVQRRTVKLRGGGELINGLGSRGYFTYLETGYIGGTTH